MSLLSMGELAHRSGFAPSALRFYERQGLIEATRTGGGQRRFERGVLRRLAFIRAATTVGLSLDEVGEALRSLPAARTPTKQDWTRLSRGWRVRLDDQIAAMTALRDRLDSCIGCGCLTLRSCAVTNPQDVMATQGPGARLLPRSARQPLDDLSAG